MADSSKKTQRLLVASLIFAYYTAHGLLLLGYRYLDDLTREKTGTFLPRLIEEMTGAYGGAIIFPLVVLFVRKFRLRWGNLLRLLPLHLLALSLFSAAHTTLNAVTRWTLFPVAGLGDYDYGIMSIRYAMEFSNDVISYTLIVGFIYLFDHYRQSRDREVLTAQLETRLAQAQLQSLRLQLQPHFLFNTLNTISAMIYENPRAADEMIARLSDLLRMTLRNSQSQEVTLAEELEFLNLYVEIMKARFEERLVVRIDVESSTHSALVPQLLLQPLVENSIRHAIDPRGRVAIDVRSTRENGSLILEVIDDGPGITGDSKAMSGGGIGLLNTAERLRQLYGEAHDFALANAEGGGLAVRITVPFRQNGFDGEASDVEDSSSDSR
ncbi:MAG: histidine kinase [Acidobacteriota bacterium]